MKIKYFAYIRDYTNSKEIDYKHCKTVRKLLLELCEMHGKKFSDKIFNDEELSDEVIILVNGRNIVHLDGLDTHLDKNDEICIFPVVAGG